VKFILLTAKLFKIFKEIMKNPSEELNELTKNFSSNEVCI
jgi:hypothetical protein